MAHHPNDLELEKGNPSVHKRIKGKKKLVLIVSILFFMMMAGTGSVIFFAPSLIPEGLNFFGTKGHSKEIKETQPKVQGYILNLDPFVVNLADTDPPRYLKIKIDIESQELKANEESVKRLPQLRDAILTILSGRTYKEVYDSEGKKKLKEEILLKANQILANFKVKTVYFTEFVVQ